MDSITGQGRKTSDAQSRRNTPAPTSADLYFISHKALGWGSLAPDSYSNPQATSQQVRERNGERENILSW